VAEDDVAADSSSPLTKPKVSSLRPRVDPLDHWEYHWMEKHGQHLDPDEKRVGNVPDDEVLYGPLPREVEEKERTLMQRVLARYHTGAS
jgi:hypothetical protein